LNQSLNLLDLYRYRGLCQCLFFLFLFFSVGGSSLLVNVGGSSVESSLFFGSLESTVTDLAGSIDEFQADLFVGSSANLREQTLSEDKSSLSKTDASTLDHDVVIVNDTVVGETTHGGNVLFGQVVGGGSVVLTVVFNTSTDSVDLLVDFSSVVITALTTSGNGELNSSRMPGTDTSDLSETSMGLSG